MFDFICGSAPLILNGEVVEIRKLSRIFLFSKVCLATFQINSTLVIIRLSGRMSPTIRPDSRIPEKHAGQPDTSRIPGATLVLIFPVQATHINMSYTWRNTQTTISLRFSANIQHQHIFSVNDRRYAKPLHLQFLQQAESLLLLERHHLQVYLVKTLVLYRRTFVIELAIQLTSECVVDPPSY